MAYLDDDLIRSTVGAAAHRTGAELVTRGVVSGASVVNRAGKSPIVVGSVRDGGSRPYTVVVSLVGPLGGAPLLAFGRCSCPARANCEHVAAVMIDAGGGPPGAAGWERALGCGTGRPPDDAAIRPIGLQVSWDGGKHGRVTMRPVVLNDRDRWVTGGISWSEMVAGRARQARPADAAALLQEIAALHAAGVSAYYYGTQAAVIDLDRFPSRRVWSILGEAAEAGLALLDGGTSRPLLLSTEPATPGLDAVDQDGDLVLTPTLTVSGRPIGDEVRFLGEPAHGVAWRSGLQHGESGTAAGVSVGAAVNRPPRVLHLARVDRTLPDALGSTVIGGHPVTVPRADRPRFLAHLYPALRRSVAISSSDGTALLPVPDPPRLELLIGRGHTGPVSLTWAWLYRSGSTEERFDPDSGDGADIRDPDAEAALSARVIALVAPLPDLLAWRTAGPVLASRVELSGPQAIRFEREVLGGLSALQQVQVVVGDGMGMLGEATREPVISLSGTAETGTDWFDLCVTVTVDGQAVPFLELFVALAAGEEFLLLPSGTYFALDRRGFRRLRALIEESRALVDIDRADIRVSRFQANFWAELEALGVLDQQAAAWSARLRDLAALQTVEPPPRPEQLLAELRPYQQSGYQWLAFLHDNGLGGVLADDMGLGKTVQALALICHARQDKPGAAPFLVVAPTSVVGNWAAECRRFAPDLRIAVITATEARRGIPLEEICAGMDVVVTSYALFRLEYDDYAAVAWSGLLLDEAQYLKNHHSKGYQCAKRLPAPFKLVVTGTPMENNLMELWSMFSLTAPGLLPDARRFTEFYRTPIERSGDEERLDLLRRRIRPLMMRRTKQEVAAELPAKTEQVIELDLEPAHRRAYQRHLQRERQKVLGLLSDFEKNRFEIFRSLTLLRQAALDVSLVDPDQRVPATKLGALMELVEEVVAGGHRTLVFSQFTRFLNSARRLLDDAGIRHTYLDGSTRNRQAVLEEFKDGGAPVFLISLKAGGVGLNLTEADYCILLAPWWNPAVEAQAVDRVHRIGQDRAVMVYRLVARDTIEQKVMALKSRKAALFSSIMTDGGVGAGGLTAADIRGLLE